MKNISVQLEYINLYVYVLSLIKVGITLQISTILLDWWRNVATIKLITKQITLKPMRAMNTFFHKPPINLCTVCPLRKLKKKKIGTREIINVSYWRKFTIFFKVNATLIEICIRNIVKTSIFTCQFFSPGWKSGSHKNFLGSFLSATSFFNFVPVFSLLSFLFHIRRHINTAYPRTFHTCTWWNVEK